MASLLVLALLCGSAYAQETWGSVRGTVTDPSGAAVPNARVELTGANLVRPMTATTSTSGAYVFQQVPVGTNYALSVAADGFRTAKASGMAVELGKASTLDITMEVGSLAESVVVSAEASLVDTQSSTSAVTVDQSFFSNLPKGRSFYDLIAIAPGARNEGKGGGFEIDGASGSENVYYLDGMEVTNIQTGVLSTQNRIPNEMVQQIQIKNGVMEAQYGGAMGGVVNAVVRSGSNDFHGQAGFYFNNDAMAAQGQFMSEQGGGIYNQRRVLRLDPLDENKSQYVQAANDSFTVWNPVFDIGGPLIKNKLFFFAAFMPQSYDATRNVNFTDGSKGTYSNHFLQHYTAAKVDYAPLSKLRINTSWIWNPQYTRGYLPTWQGTDSKTAPWADEGNYTASNILAGEVNYLATSKLVLSFRGGYSFNNYSNNYGLPNYTAIYYSGKSTTMPPADLQAPNGWVQNPTSLVKFDTYIRKNYNADASYIMNWGGQHQLKGGWQMNQLSNSVNKSDYANGYYRYYWGNSYTCVTSQCSGKQTGPLGYYRYRVLGTYGDASSDNQGIFLQDNWKVNRRLTLNLGIRSEREFLPSFSYAGVAAAPPIEFSWGQKVSPRLGFALDPTGTGKQRIYGSWGYFYDVMKYEMPRGSFGGDVWLEWYQSFDDPNWVKTNAGPPADPSKLPGKFYEMVNWRIPSNDPSAGLIDPDLKPMKQRMFDIGYDYSFNSTMVGSARYTNRRLIRTIEDIGYIGEDGETYIIGNPGIGYTADPANWQRWMGSGIPTTYKARRDYDAVELRLDKRFARNYQFSASYTWSRLYGNYSGLASSDEAGRNSPNVNRYFDQPWVGYDQTGHVANGRLATDRPNTFKFFGSYTKNWGHAGSTTLSPNIFLYSGTPITTEVPVVSSTPMFPFGRGDLGRTPFYQNYDLNLVHELAPLKNHEAVRVRFELAVFNLFNNATVTDKFKTILHSSDGQLYFTNAAGDPDYASIFKGFDTRKLMTEQGDRIDPQYGMANSFQGPRWMRIQMSFIF